MHHPSVSWHIIPLKLSSWKSICFGQKEPIKVQFSGLLSALMKVHPILQDIFETIRSGFIQVLHCCSVSWKITPLCFCSSNLVYFRQKEPIKNKFSDFWVVEWKFTKSLMSYLIGSFCWKYIKFQLKKYRRVVSWHWRVMQNLKRNWFIVSKLTRNWWILT